MAFHDGEPLEDAPLHGPVHFMETAIATSRVTAAHPSGITVVIDTVLERPLLFFIR
jgi:hypothetical protein